MKSIIAFLLLMLSQALLSADLPTDHPTVKDTLNATGVTPDEKSAPLPNIGTVVDTIHSNNYTYIELRNEGKNIWLAAPKVELLKDTKIRYGRGLTMVNFYSNGLKREFPEIFFVERVQIVK